jgi:hypothetical protein
MWGCGLDSCGSEYGPMAGCYEHGNGPMAGCYEHGSGPSGSLKVGEFIELLTKECVLWRQPCVGLCVFRATCPTHMHLEHSFGRLKE